jgi:hypothetical protein
MSEHIIRRGSPPTTPPAPTRRRRRTIEISEQELHGLIHGPTQDDLEPELELLDVTPESFPDCTPTGLSSSSSQRLAHTMRRGAVSATPATPVPTVMPATLPERTNTSKAERVVSAPPAASAPRAASTPPAASAPRVASAPRTASAPLPQLFLPSLHAPDAEPREMTEIRTMVFTAPASKAPIAAATPIRTLLRTERARLVLLVTGLGLGLGAAASWLL